MPRVTEQAKKMPRERLALVFFAFLVVIGLGALGLYMFSVGHSFNVVATNVDDATGNLEDYTAILYEGTVEEKQAIELDVGSIIPGSDDVSKRLNEQAQTQGGTTQEGDVTASNALGEAAEGEDAVPLTVDNLKRSYIDKKASVLVLDMIDPDAYSQYKVIRAGKFTFGMLGIFEPVKQSQIDERLAAYKAADVDFVLAVTGDLTYVDGLEGLDIVICTQDEALFPMGITVDSTFYDDAVCYDEVGTILVSPARVISGKDITHM